MQTFALLALACSRFFLLVSAGKQVEPTRALGGIPANFNSSQLHVCVLEYYSTVSSAASQKNNYPFLAKCFQGLHLQVTGLCPLIHKELLSVLGIRSLKSNFVHLRGGAFIFILPKPFQLFSSLSAQRYHSLGAQSEGIHLYFLLYYVGRCVDHLNFRIGFAK